MTTLDGQPGAATPAGKPLVIPGSPSALREATPAPKVSAPTQLTILTTRFWPDRHGGVEEHMWRIATEAAAAGTQVQVLTENRLQLTPTEQPLPNITIERAPRLDPGAFWRWPYLPRMRWWMKQLRRHPPLGWIWAVDPPSAMAAIMCGYGARTIYNPPSCWAAMHRVYEARPHVTTMRIAKGFRVMERYVYHHAAKVVVASKAIGQQYVNFHGVRSNVHVVPRGAGDELLRELPSTNVARQLFGFSPTSFVVGFVGRLDPCKDLPHLIKACAMPGVLTPNDRLLLVGEGPDRARVENALAVHGIQDRTVLTGALEGSELLAAYASMSLLVLPSVYEGYGMVILEAMAAGLPVIGRPGDGQTSFTSMEEMIEHGKTGLLMHPTREEDLGDKLRWFRYHLDQARDMGRRGREQLSKRPWRQVVGDYLDILAGREPRAAEPTRHAA